MGSQQSKQATPQPQQLQKFKSFWTMFLASVEEIASNPEKTRKIELANGGVVPLTWEILEKKFPGCVQCQNGRKILLTSQLWYLVYSKCNLDVYATFWEANRKQVRAFYNGEF